MIRTLAVHGYRSLQDIALELGDLTVVTGGNGVGKSNVYRALTLLSRVATGDLVGALAREGGLESVLFAGPERSSAMHRGEAQVTGTMPRGPVRLAMGYASDDLGYLVDLGIPPSARSAFDRDPHIKREVVFTGPTARPATQLVRRKGPHVEVRDGTWLPVEAQVGVTTSMVEEFADPGMTPEVLQVRRTLRRWRFHDGWRTDALSPARLPQVGTRTPVLGHDGGDLAAAWQTIVESGGGSRLDDAVELAFPGSAVQVRSIAHGATGMLLHMSQRGMLRPLSAAELSDGTLRYLMLVAALLAVDAPDLLVLNEPETSLHPELVGPLAELIGQASMRAQVVVVTHSAQLAESLAASSARAGLEHVHHELIKELGATAVAGRGLLDGPAWEWPSR